MQTEPETATPALPLRAWCARAMRAPSSHNTQPWRFRIEGPRALALRADRTRRLPVNDPQDRELTISCGAALLHLRVVAAAAGAGTSVAVLPAAGDPDLLARVRFDGAPIEPLEASLASVIESRRTVRGAMHERPLGDALLGELAGLAAREGAWLHVVRDAGERSAIADLVAEGDRALWSDPAWRRELAAWMRSPRAGEGLAMPPPVAPVVRAAVRTFDLGGRLAGSDRAMAAAAPTLVVVGTERDDPASWLAAGQALARVLLRAAIAGAQASYLNQPVQVPALRARLAERVGRGGAPQLVLRLGFPREDAPRAPRRPVDDVLERA